MVPQFIESQKYYVSITSYLTNQIVPCSKFHLVSHDIILLYVLDTSFISKIAARMRDKKGSDPESASADHRRFVSYNTAAVFIFNLQLVSFMEFMWPMKITSGIFNREKK
jgi:hypothetical protein